MTSKTRFAAVAVALAVLPVHAAARADPGSRCAI